MPHIPSLLCTEGFCFEGLNCCLNILHKEGHFNLHSLLFSYSEQADSIAWSRESWNRFGEEGVGSARSGLCYYNIEEKKSTESGDLINRPRLKTLGQECKV